ncbi:MAG: ABC transporter permease [Firmicutes bacterium]|nr:ABC transporter permease [Bacillota bacterium]
MIRTLKSIKGDIFLQFNYGFYLVYTIVTIMYIFLLNFLPEEALIVIVPFIIFSDPSVLGFFFISGLVLLEKGEGVLEYLIITPLQVKEYIISKLVSLTFLSLITSIIIEFFSFGKNINYPIFLVGITLTSFLFILIGFIAVSRFPTINKYLLSSVGYIIVLCLPLIGYFGIFKSRLFYLFPTQASLLLISGAFKGIDTWQLIYSILYLLVWIAATFKIANISFYKYIILKKGDN